MNVIRRLTAAGRAALAVLRVEGPAARGFVATHFGKTPVDGQLAYGIWRRTDGSRLDDPLVRGGDGFFDVNLHGGPAIVDAFCHDAEAAGFTITTDDGGRLAQAKTAEGVRWLLAQETLTGEPRPDDRTLERLLVPSRIAFVGPPNAGKSTLVNHLAGRDVSLVSPEAGTTRDWIEADAVLADGRLPVVLLDLPGRRETSGIEAAAIELSREAVASADLVVLVLDATRPELVPDGFDDALRVYNKADLARPPHGGVAVSAHLGTTAALESALLTQLGVDLDEGPRRCDYLDVCVEPVTRPRLCSC